MKKRFLFHSIVVFAMLLCFINTAYAAMFSTDGSFEKESVGISAGETEDFSYYWSHSIVSGTAEVSEENDNKYLSVTGYSEFYTFDSLTAPYTFSVDVKLNTPGDVNVFIRGGRNESAPFPFYEWDWYAEKGGKNGSSSTGGPGLIVQLTANSIRVRIKNMQSDAENEQICSVFYEFPAPEGYDVKKFNTIMFKDDGAKIEIFFNGTLLATAEMSDKGTYEGDEDHEPVNFTYFKKVVLKDSEGNEVLNVDNARVVADYPLAAVSSRNHPFYMDNITLSYEKEETPEPTNTATPSKPSNTQVVKTPEVTNKPVTKNNNSNIFIYVAIAIVCILAVVFILFIIKSKRSKVK